MVKRDGGRVSEREKVLTKDHIENRDREIERGRERETKLFITVKRNGERVSEGEKVLTKNHIKNSDGNQLWMILREEGEKSLRDSTMDHIENRQTEGRRERERDLKIDIIDIREGARDQEK